MTGPNFCFSLALETKPENESAEKIQLEKRNLCSNQRCKIYTTPAMFSENAPKGTELCKKKRKKKFVENMLGLFFIVFYNFLLLYIPRSAVSRCEHAVCNHVLKHFILDRRDDYMKMLLTFILLLCIDLMVLTEKSSMKQFGTLCESCEFLMT